MANHDIFICYSSKDEAQARTVLQGLEARGSKCWISSRDVRPGHNYQESIVKAIQGAKALVFLFSDFSNHTGEVKKELSLASTFNIAVIPLRLTDTKPNSALMYELSTRQWIDAFPDLETALDDVAAAVREALNADAEPAADAPPRPTPPVVATSRAEVPRPRSAAVVGDEEREAIRRLLAHHVGPIAKILVERAAATAATRDQLCENLAAHITAPSDRAAFLRAVRARLSVS